MKKLLSKKRMLRKIAALALCLSVASLSLTVTPLKTSATITPHPKIDLTYLLDSTSNAETGTAEGRGAWDPENQVVQVKSIYPSAPISTKAALIDGYKQAEIDYTNGTSYVSNVNSGLDVDEWVVINLQKLYKVNQVSFTPAAYSIWYNGFPVDFTVEVSENGEDWNTVVSKTGYEFTLNQSDFLLPFEEDVCQYIRFNCTKILLEWNGTISNLALQEIEVFGVEASTDPDPDPDPNPGENEGSIQILEDGKLDFTPLLGGATGENLVGWDAAKKYISTSHSLEQVAWAPYNGKAFLVDGSMDTESGYYVSCTYDPNPPYLADVNDGQNVDEWILLDLQQSYNLNKFTFSSLFAGNNFGMPEDFKIEVSLDGTTWETVVNKTGFGMSGGATVYSFDFEPQLAQYVRLSVSKIADSYGATADPRKYSLIITEIELYTVLDTEEAGIRVLEDGKLDFTSIFEGAKDEALVGWDDDEKYISASHSLEQASWAPYNGKAFLVDGSMDIESGYYVSCTYDPNPPYLADVNDGQDVDEWILFDLQESYNLNKFSFSSLYAGNDFGMPEDFKIEVSLDGTTWKTVVNKTGFGMSGGTSVYNFDFEPQLAQYVRFSVSKIADSYGATADTRKYSLIITEIELYTVAVTEEARIRVLEDGKLDFTPIFEGATGNDLVNWESEDEYISTSHSLEAAWDPPAGKAFLVDGSINGDSGYWASCSLVPDTTDLTNLNQDPEIDEWIYFNLQEKFNIGRFAFAPRYKGLDTGMPKDFKLEVSEDGVIWETVVSKTGYSSGRKDICNFEFAPSPTQYIRFSATKVAAADQTLKYSLQLSEIEFYETEGYDGDDKVPPDTSAGIVLPVVIACLLGSSIFLFIVMKPRRKASKIR